VTTGLHTRNRVHLDGAGWPGSVTDSIGHDGAVLAHGDAARGAGAGDGPQILGRLGEPWMPGGAVVDGGEDAAASVAVVAHGDAAAGARATHPIQNEQRLVAPVAPRGPAVPRRQDGVADHVARGVAHGHTAAATDAADAVQVQGAPVRPTGPGRAAITTGHDRAGTTVRCSPDSHALASTSAGNTKEVRRAVGGPALPGGRTVRRRQDSSCCADGHTMIVARATDTFQTGGRARLSALPSRPAIPRC